MCKRRQPPLGFFAYWPYSLRPDDNAIEFKIFAIGFYGFLLVAAIFLALETWCPSVLETCNDFVKPLIVKSR